MTRFEALAAKIARHRHASWPDLLAKTARFLQECGGAAIHLRACDRVGPGARVAGRPRIRNEGRMELGTGIEIRSHWAPVELATERGALLTIGDGTAINYGTMISAASSVTLGRRVMIGNYCVVADTHAPGTGARSSSSSEPIVIEDDVWLAVRVTVLPGARIGAGTTVVAGSVVSGELPSGVIAGGVPARVLRASVPPPIPVET